MNPYRVETFEDERGERRCRLVGPGVNMVSRGDAEYRKRLEEFAAVMGVAYSEGVKAKENGT